MPEFLKLQPPEDALQQFLESLPEDSRTEPERIPTEDALNRVLAEAISAPHPLPPFARTTVDGYAVLAADTYGASERLPAYLEIVGEVSMGQTTPLTLQSGQAALVHTGGMIPAGGDAVVMIEDTQKAGASEVEVLTAVAVGQNVLVEGEDVKAGELVLEAGVKLRPQEIGGLMALGITSVEVARRPRVGILSTGDEVVPPDVTPSAGQVRDVNSYTLNALVRNAGGQPILRGIIPDQYDALFEATREAHREDDVVIITAGSSVSTRDLTAQVIDALGDPGVLVHGVSIKPGKPTILAVADGIPMIGLPGNPVSALVVAGYFVVPVIRQLLGLDKPAEAARVSARMSVNVAAETGREDYLPVRLSATPQGLLAEPIYGRSNLIFTLVRADGLVRIPAEATGLDAGAEVEVRLF
ncbi:MAG: molybdopterin molybdenumtransferase MoeA [Anaerolineales bacterium]|nr:molybdopterin molybdenumtransferase MoeA [Anaerolineales bacterium]